jgi:serine phosphatase RsbU (regulator of sigma subunit)
MHLLSILKNNAVKAVEPVHSLAPEVRGAELAAVYYGERVGGDFYDFIRVSPSRVVFGLLDVAGRSEHNRAIVTAVQKAFREESQRLLAGDDVNEADAMSELCLKLNHTVLDVAGEVRSCPAFAGCYNEDLGLTCYFNAGHTPGLVRDSTGITELPATGLPLGLFSHATCDSFMAALPPKAALVLVSRGVVEARGKGEELGLAGVKQLLARTEKGSARDLCMEVVDGVRQFLGSPPTHNDVTVLSMVRNAR